MPPRKQTRSKRAVIEETQRIPIDDIEDRLGDATPVRSLASRDTKSRYATTGNTVASSSSKKVSSLSRSTRRLAALLVEQNPPTLPRSDMLGALSYSEESATSSASGGSDEDDESGTARRAANGRRARLATPDRVTDGDGGGVADDSPVSHLTSGRHTVSLSKTMKQFDAVPHHLATTSAFAGRPFKPPSSTATVRTGKIGEVTVAVSGAETLVAVMPFIDTQLPDVAHELKATAKPPAPVSTTAAAPSSLELTATSQSSTSSHPVPVFTDVTERELLSDSQDVCGGEGERHTADSASANDEVLAGSLETPPERLHHSFPRRSHKPDDDGEEEDDTRDVAAAQTGGGEVLLDSLGAPGQTGARTQGDGEAKAVPFAESAGSTPSTPRLMVTPQPTAAAGSHLLGGGLSLGKLSPLSAPPPPLVMMAAQNGTAVLRAEVEESASLTAATNDDYAQTLAVYDLSLRSAAPTGLFDTPPLPPTLDVLDTSPLDKPMPKAVNAEKKAAAATFSRAPPQPLPETVDDGCYKPDAVACNEEEEDDEDAEAEGQGDHSGNAVLGEANTTTSTVGRRGTVLNHAMLVESARAAAPRHTPASDPFLTPKPSAVKRSLSRQKKSSSPAPKHSTDSATTTRALFTVGMAVEARWGRNWYPAIVSEDERSGYVQIRWADEAEDAVLHLKVREVRLPKSLTDATAAAGEAAGLSKVEASKLATANDTAAVDAVPRKALSSSTHADAVAALTASQLSELMELEVLTAADLKPPGTTSSPPRHQTLPSRKRTREFTSTHSEGKTTADVDVDDANAQDGKRVRLEGDEARDVRIHGSHLVLFAARPETVGPCLSHATIVSDFDAFLRLATHIGAQYHAQEEPKISDAASLVPSLQRPPPPLCLYVVEDGDALAAREHGDGDEAVLNALSSSSSSASASAASSFSPAASWEVLIAHALGLAAVRASWLTQLTSAPASVQHDDCCCSLPHEADLLHVLRHVPSTRPSSELSKPPPADAEGTTTTTTVAHAARVVDGFIPWQEGSRFLHGTRIYMPHTTATRLDRDPMARLLRAAGAEPVSEDAPARHSPRRGATKAAAASAPALDFVYVPPGPAAAQAHTTLLANTPSLKGVSLLELPWLVKNIEAQFARRQRTAQPWWWWPLSASSSRGIRDVLTAWSVARPSDTQEVDHNDNSRDDADRERPRDAPQNTTVEEQEQTEQNNIPAGEPRSLSRPPPLAPATSTTPGRRAAHAGGAGGGISPTTIAAIKARGRRAAQTTSPKTPSPQSVHVKEEEPKSARRSLSDEVEAVARHHHANDDEEQEDASMILGECVSHPPVNEGEDYYYRVPLSSHARRQLVDSGSEAAASGAAQSVAHELGLGRVAGVQHDASGSETGTATTSCVAHLQLYTVRRVVMRENPTTGDLEQQTTVGLSQRVITVPISALLFEVPVYVVHASALRHVYVLEDEAEDSGVDHDHIAGEGAVSQAPLATAPLSPPRPTVRLEAPTLPSALKRPPLPQQYGNAHTLPSPRA